MNIKNFVLLIKLFLYLMGAIGGFGYACYYKAYVIAIAVVELAIMAFPTAKKWWKEMNDLK